MPNSNQITLAGHLTRDPELRCTPKGVAVCSFGLAVSEKRGDTEKAHFFDCKCWYETAEEVKANLKKGSAAVVVGKLEFEQWDDKETGAKRNKVSVNANIVASPLYRNKDGESRSPRARTPASATDNPSPIDKEGGAPF